MSNCRINIFEPGNVLSNKWVIFELIGKGAMGKIYLAHQLNLKRDVAIKVVSEELLKDFEDDPDEIETSFQRFKREVHAMARVRHPNVLQIFDYGSAVIQRETGDCPVEFIAMEYIPGDTLRFTMSEEGFYPEQNLIKDWLEGYFLPVLAGNALSAEISWMHVQHREYGNGKALVRLGFGLIDDCGNYLTDNRNVKEIKLFDPDKRELKLAPLNFDSVEEIFGTYDSKNSQWLYSKVWQFDSWYNTEIMESFDIYKDKKNVGYFSIILPVHMGYVFIPQDVVQSMNQKGNQFEMKILLETKDKNSRTYSKPLIVNEMRHIVSGIK